MTITTTHNHKSYAADGNSYAVDYEFYDAAELVVYKLAGANLAQYTLYTLTTDYTVSGGAGATGTVTWVSGAPGSSSEELHIHRKSLTTQSTTLPLSGTFPSPTMTDRFDRNALRMQDTLLDRDTGRPFLANSSGVTVGTSVLDMFASSDVMTSTATGTWVSVSGSVPVICDLNVPADERLYIELYMGTNGTSASDTLEAGVTHVHVLGPSDSADVSVVFHFPAIRVANLDIITLAHSRETSTGIVTAKLDKGGVLYSVVGLY